MEVQIPLASLSEADQQWVRDELVKARKGKELTEKEKAKMQKGAKKQADTLKRSGNFATTIRSNETTEPATRDAKAVEIQTFAGRWKIVNDKGEVGCYFTLDRALAVKKSHVPDATGKWEIVGGEARITWSDGWKDILRPENGRVAKIAFGPGKSWEDKPDNSQFAVNGRNVPFATKAARLVVVIAAVAVIAGVLKQPSHTSDESTGFRFFWHRVRITSSQVFGVKSADSFDRLGKATTLRTTVLGEPTR